MANTNPHHYVRNMTANEAQAYLVAHNIPVVSRPAFYRYLERHNIPYSDLTPWSKKQTRRFSKEELDIFLESLGVAHDEDIHLPATSGIEAEQTAQSAD